MTQQRNKNRRPGIYQRGKTWTAHIRWTDIHGVEHQKKVGRFRTQREATEFRDKFLSDVRSGRTLGTQTPKLCDYLTKEWLPQRQSELKPSTYETYDTIVNRYIIPHIGELRLHELTPRRIEDFFKHLQAQGATGHRGGQSGPLSSKSISNISGVLNRALRDAQRWEMINHNPVSVAVKPPVKHAEIQVWTPEQLGTFVEHITEHRLCGPYTLIATTGMRRGEILGLTWDNVDLEKQQIAINTTRIRAGNAVVYQSPKSDASRRTISIDAHTTEALRKWRIAQAEERLAIGEHWPDKKGHVVTEPDGRLPDPNTFTRRFKAICQKLKLPVIRLHDLRHSYVVASRKAGVPLKTISARVGHADINVTSRVYDHVLRDDDEDAAEQTVAFIRQRRAT